jgi:hypothetical protein
VKLPLWLRSLVLLPYRTLAHISHASRQFYGAVFVFMSLQAAKLRRVRLSAR